MGSLTFEAWSLNHDGAERERTFDTFAEAFAFLIERMGGFLKTWKYDNAYWREGYIYSKDSDNKSLRLLTLTRDGAKYFYNQ